MRGVIAALAAVLLLANAVHARQRKHAAMRFRAMRGDGDEDKKEEGGSEDGADTGGGGGGGGGARIAPGADTAGLGYNIFRDTVVHPIFNIQCGDSGPACVTETKLMGDVAHPPSVTLIDEAVYDGSTESTFISNEREAREHDASSIGISLGFAMFKGSFNMEHSSESSMSELKSEDKFITTLNVHVFRVKPRSDEVLPVCEDGRCEGVLDESVLDPVFVQAVQDLPVPADPRVLGEEDLQAYKSFIQSFGTHLVTEVTVGGQVTMTTRTEKGSTSTSEREEMKAAMAGALEKAAQPDSSEAVTTEITDTTTTGGHEHTTTTTIEPAGGDGGAGDVAGAAAQGIARVGAAVASGGATEFIPDLSVSVSHSRGSEESAKFLSEATSSSFKFEGCDPTVANIDDLPTWVGSCKANPTVISMRVGPMSQTMLFGRPCGGGDDSKPSFRAIRGRLTASAAVSRRESHSDAEDEEYVDGPSQHEAAAAVPSGSDMRFRASGLSLRAADDSSVGMPFPLTMDTASASSLVQAGARAGRSGSRCVTGGFGDAIKRREAYESALAEMQKTTQKLILAQYQLQQARSEQATDDKFQISSCDAVNTAAAEVNKYRKELDPHASPDELEVINDCSLTQQIERFARAFGEASASSGSRRSRRGGKDGAGGATGDSDTAMNSNDVAADAVRGPICEYCVAVMNARRIQQARSRPVGETLPCPEGVSCSQAVATLYGNLATVEEKNMHHVEAVRRSALHDLKDASCTVGGTTFKYCPTSAVCRRAKFCNEWELVLTPQARIRAEPHAFSERIVATAKDTSDNAYSIMGAGIGRYGVEVDVVAYNPFSSSNVFRPTNTACDDDVTSDERNAVKQAGDDGAWWIDIIGVPGLVKGKNLPDEDDLGEHNPRRVPEAVVYRRDDASAWLSFPMSCNGVAGARGFPHLRAIRTTRNGIGLLSTDYYKIAIAVGAEDSVCLIMREPATYSREDADIDARESSVWIKDFAQLGELLINSEGTVVPGGQIVKGRSRLLLGAGATQVKCA